MIFMKIKHQLYNLNQSAIEILRKISYMIFPIIGKIIFLILYKSDLINLNIIRVDNIINLSGIFAGFILTAFGVIMSLPDNNFTRIMKKSGYMIIIYRTLLLGVLFFVISMVLGLFTLHLNCISTFFIFGLSEAILTVYYFYKLVTLSEKSS